MSDGRQPSSPVQSENTGRRGRYRGGSPLGSRRQPQTTWRLANTPEEELARRLRAAIDANREGLVVIEPTLAEALYQTLIARLAAIAKRAGPPAKWQDPSREAE